MTFLERYQKEDTWYGRVIIMEIYHLAMTQIEKDWTVTKTAEFFGLSIGLVSENLKLADALHTKPYVINCKSRVEALKRI